MKIKVYIQPQSSRTEIVGLHAEALKIKVKSPPVDGEANQELIRFLAEFLELPKKNVILLHGQTSRHKLIELVIDTSQEFEIKRRLKLNQN